MAKQAVRTDSAPRPVGPYSQAVRSGDLVFVAGQGPLDPATGTVVGQSIEEQTARVMDNIKAILAAAGCAMDDVLKSTVHLANLADFSRFNAVYGSYFAEPFPARTTVGSTLPNILVEIDVVARIPHTALK